MSLVPPGCAGRRERAFSRPRISSIRRLPASLPRTPHRSPATKRIMSEPLTLRYRWAVLAAGTAAAAAGSALFIGPAVLAPAIREEFDASLSQVGVLLASLWVGTILTLLGWGLLADRLGERVVLGTGLGICGLFATAAGWAGDFWALLGLLFLECGRCERERREWAGRDAVVRAGGARTCAGNPPDGDSSGSRDLRGRSPLRRVGGRLRGGLRVPRRVLPRCRVGRLGGHP